MSTRTPTVPYVTGRKKALARAVAQTAVSVQGFVWDSLGEQERQRLVADAMTILDRWIAEGVLAEFLNEYREKGNG